jgi:hypothetical protein
MEPTASLKKNPNQSIADELTKQIIDRSASDQNEIFCIIRANLVAERQRYVESLMAQGRELQYQIDFATDTLKNYLLAELK